MHVHRRWLAALVIIGFGSTLAAAQDYPTRPIRAVTAAVGGGIDFTARLVAAGLTNNLGQQVIVDNRGGTGVAQTMVARATPDGYTILVNNNTVWLSPLLEKVHYDYRTELLPVSLTTRSPAVLVVHPSLGVNSVKELIALAKAKPGDINYASGPMGAANHLSAELFKALAGSRTHRLQGRWPGVE